MKKIVIFTFLLLLLMSSFASAEIVQRTLRSDDLTGQPFKGVNLETGALADDGSGDNDLVFAGAQDNAEYNSVHVRGDTSAFCDACGVFTNCAPQRAITGVGQTFGVLLTGGATPCVDVTVVAYTAGVGGLPPSEVGEVTLEFDATNLASDNPTCNASNIQTETCDIDGALTITGNPHVAFTTMTGTINAGEVQIGSDWVSVDSGSVADVPATIEFTTGSLGYSPIPYKDGSICTSECSNINYEAGVLSFDVSGFSNYTYGSCSTLNGTCTPCSGGWTGTSLNNQFYNYDFTTDPNGYGDITGWDVSCITNMDSTFERSNFNQDIGGWDVSNVTDMGEMFYIVSEFNQDISGWNVSKVTDMSNMFNFASSFNQEIGGWDVSSVTSFSNMFYGASVFNGDINNWNISGIVNVDLMFLTAFAFNQDLDQWDVSQITSMNQMFMEARNFNGNITNWDTGSVTNMRQMFNGARKFNQDIGGWDVSSATNMVQMFRNAYDFNHNLGAWNVSGVTSFSDFFMDGGGLSTTNYDSTLNGWAQLPTLSSGEAIGFNGTQYSCFSWDSRSYIQDTYSWSIADGGYNGTNITECYPQLNSYNPLNLSLMLFPASTQLFEVNVSVVDGDTVSYEWYINGDLQSENTSAFNYTIPSNETDPYQNITVYYDDGTINDTFEWNITINSYPVIDSFTPSNTTPSIVSGGSQAFVVNASDADNDTLIYSWYVNGEIKSGETSPSYLYESVLEDVNNKNITVVVHDGFVNVSQEWDLSITYDDVVFTYVLHTVEEDYIRIDPSQFGDSYLMYLDNESYLNSSSTSVELFSLTQNITYEFKFIPVQDGFYGQPVEFSVTTDESTEVPPTIDYVSIKPSTIYTDTALTGYCQASDVDSASLDYVGTWLVNGSSVLTITHNGIAQGTNKSFVGLSSGNYSYEDNVTFICAVDDNVFPASTNNFSLTVQNAFPDLQQININDYNTTHYACNYTYSDADGDAQQTTSYLWYENGLATTNTSATVTKTSFTAGDSLVCKVTTSDGVTGNISENSTPYIIGDDVSPMLSITEIENVVYMDTSALVEVVCTDNQAVANDYPYIFFTTPNGDNQTYILNAGVDDTYYRYITYSTAGTYTNVKVVCADGNGNTDNETHGDIYSSVRTTSTAASGGGGGGGVVIEEAVSFDVSPDILQLAADQDGQYQSEFEVVNTGNSPLSATATVLVDERTPFVQEWVFFDNEAKTTTFTVPYADDISPNNKFVRLVVDVPSDVQDGTYYAIVEVDVEGSVKTVVVEIVVGGTLYTTLRDYLQIELFEIPYSRSSLSVVDGEVERVMLPIQLGTAIIFVASIISLFFLVRFLRN